MLLATGKSKDAAAIALNRSLSANVFGDEAMQAEVDAMYDEQSTLAAEMSNLVRELDSYRDYVSCLLR